MQFLKSICVCVCAWRDAYVNKSELPLDTMRMLSGVQSCHDVQLARHHSKHLVLNCAVATGIVCWGEAMTDEQEIMCKLENILEVR